MKAKVSEWETNALEAPEGAIRLTGGISFSDPAGGCGTPGCNCSPGWWFMVALPVDHNGIVKGWTIDFNNVKDMRDFLESANERISAWLERPF